MLLASLQFCEALAGKLSAPVTEALADFLLQISLGRKK